MQILLYFFLGLSSFLVSNGNKIKIQIDTDDIVKLLDGALNSETLKNFAHQIVERGAAKRLGYKNPFHPEDELVNTFDVAMEKEKEANDIRMDTKNKMNPLNDQDPLDKENDQFFISNEVVSDDVLTEREIPLNHIEVKAKKQTTTPRKRKLATRKPNLFDEIIANKVLTRKDDAKTYHDDRENYKPRQTRFILKRSEDRTK